MIVMSMISIVFAAAMVSTNVITDVQRDFIREPEAARREQFVDAARRRALSKRPENPAYHLVPGPEVDAPRIILDPTVPNVRDCGGWRTVDGRRTRCGRVFRTAGLNGNAYAVKPTPEELKKIDPDGVLATLPKRVAGQRAEFERLAHHLDELKLVGCRVSDEWRRYWLDDDLAPISAAVLFVRGHRTREAGEPLTAEKHIVKLGPAGGSRWSLLEGVLEADEDGYAVFGAAADWYWAMSVNDVPVRDYLDGNAARATEHVHTVCVPVRKGPNRISAIVGSGSDGYLFRCEPVKGGTRDALVACECRHLKELPAGILERTGSREPGRTRITDANRDFWLRTLGIKSDIDLRSDGECYGMTGSPLGPSVTWFHISSSAYGSMQRSHGRAAFKRVFQVFLDEKNYPIVFHCIAGQDRTGAVAYICGALLGMSEDDLALDWELSCFANRDLGFDHKSRYDHLVDGFKKSFPAPTVRERVEKYVLSLGFTEADLTRFRELNLE